MKRTAFRFVVVLIAALSAAIASVPDRMRVSAGEALFDNDRDDERTVRELIEKLKDKDAITREAAALKLGNMRAKAVPAVSALAGLLTDPEEDVRAVAAQALGQIGPGAKAAIPALSAALKDKSESVRPPKL